MYISTYILACLNLCDVPLSPFHRHAMNILRNSVRKFHPPQGRCLGDQMF